MPTPRTKRSPLAVAALLTAPFLYVACEPLFGSTAAVVFGALFVIATVALIWRPTALGRLDQQLRRRPRTVNLMLALAVTGVTVGVVELVAQVLVDAEVVSVYSPMRTLLPAGTADWRHAHITADRHREPDPVLLWRPAAAAPYNAQRMKGPVASVPKPPHVLRVMAYGDSNTDGPDAGGWTEHLASAIDAAVGGGATVEVLNAGVAGYSSHQGLLRFRQDVARFEPDVVLVSFGWNDLATPLGPPDKDYVPPPRWRTGLERAALRYEAVLVLRRMLLDAAPAGEDWAARGDDRDVLVHRVPPADYAANLLAFDRLAREHGTVAVFLTRPYRLPTSTLLAADGWRRGVPQYNRALLELAAANGILAVDVQSAFEAATDLFVDECHFTPEGHVRMAALVADALAGAGYVGD